MLSPRPASITGLKHTGKSSAARLAADSLNIGWYDTDDAIVSLAKDIPAADCSSIRDVYQSVGRKTFQKLEYRSLQQIISEILPGQRKAIISTGGGICDNAEAFPFLVENTVVIFLDEDPHVLYKRIVPRGIPAYLDTDRPFDHFLELSAERRKKYRAAAHCIVQVTGLNLQEIATTITGFLETKEQSWQETVSDKPFA